MGESDKYRRDCKVLEDFSLLGFEALPDIQLSTLLLGSYVFPFVFPLCGCGGSCLKLNKPAKRGLFGRSPSCSSKLDHLVSQRQQASSLAALRVTCTFSTGSKGSPLFACNKHVDKPRFKPDRQPASEPRIGRPPPTNTHSITHTRTRSNQ